MRGRVGPVRSATDGGGSDVDFGSKVKNFFGTNRDTPEARANQAAWAKEQLALEVPDATVDGKAIADRSDLIAQYIASEEEKFGREIDQATAEKEVWFPPPGYEGRALCTPRARQSEHEHATALAHTHTHKAVLLRCDLRTASYAQRAVTSSSASLPLLAGGRVAAQASSGLHDADLLDGPRAGRGRLPPRFWLRPLLRKRRLQLGYLHSSSSQVAVGRRERVQRCSGMTDTAQRRESYVLYRARP